MIRTLANSYLSPLLREHRFTKRRMTWNRNVGELVHVLNLQKGRTSNSEQVEVTMNVGVLSPRVWAICWGKDALDFAEEHDCFPRFRIGRLLADFRSDAIDRWWSLTNEQDVAQIGIELRRIVEERCIPFLDRFCALADVKTFCDTHALPLLPADKLCYAIICLLMGDRDRYDAVMCEFDDKKLQAWQPRVTEIKHRLEMQMGACPETTTHGEE